MICVWLSGWESPIKLRHGRQWWRLWSIRTFTRRFRAGKGMHCTWRVLHVCITCACMNRHKSPWSEAAPWRIDLIWSLFSCPAHSQAYQQYLDVKYTGSFLDEYGVEDELSATEEPFEQSFTRLMDISRVIVADEEQTQVCDLRGENPSIMSVTQWLIVVCDIRRENPSIMSDWLWCVI